jgi:hypothetical protein
MEFAIVTDYPSPSAHEFGNITIDSLLLNWDSSQKAVPHRFDYLKLVVWIVGAFCPWAGLAALIVSR